MLLKLALRALVTGTIEVAALGVLTRVVPGVHVANLETGVLAVVVIGLLNALLRPVVVLLAINLGLALFALIALVLNAALVVVASDLVAGFTVDSLWSAFVVALGLAVLNTLASGLLGINDDDSFYRNVVRWLEHAGRVLERQLGQPGELGQGQGIEREAGACEARWWRMGHQDLQPRAGELGHDAQVGAAWVEVQLLVRHDREAAEHTLTAEARRGQHLVRVHADQVGGQGLRLGWGQLLQADKVGLGSRQEVGQAARSGQAVAHVVPQDIETHGCD